MCPGFTSDCLETLEEISMETRHDFLSAGGKEFHYIACLNEAPSWIAALADVAEQQMLGWPTRLTAEQAQQRQQDAQEGRANAVRLGATA